MTATNNIRHDFPAGVVAARVAKDIADLDASHARLCANMVDVRRRYAQKPWPGRAPDSQEDLDRVHQDMVACQNNEYSLARVVELPQGEKRFLLVYGQVDDATVTTGTGPFATLDAAQGWFLRGGR